MKRTMQIALLAAAGFMSVNSVLAQDMATADIPFDFTVQQKTMPHGNYVIAKFEPGYIEISSKDGKFHALSLAFPTSKVRGQAGKLVFHRYGDQYFLYEVQSPWDEVGMQLPTSKAEKKAQFNEAKLHNDETAIIAMK